MRKHLAIVTVFCLSIALLAVEPIATCTFLGTPNIKHGSQDAAVLFDSQSVYNSPSIIFTGEYSGKGCGVILELAEPTALSKVIVHTSKPNTGGWGPEKSEFSIWDAEAHLWKEATVIPDVTGHIHETNFTIADCSTTWEAPAGEAIKALKIALFGGGIWLTEIEVFAADGTKLGLKKEAAALKATEALSPVATMGGIPGHATAFGPNVNFIGNPNMLPRRDRVVFTFDLDSLIPDGSVQQARLRFKIIPMGKLAVNLLAIYQITPGRNPLKADDLVFGEPTLLQEFIYDFLSNQEVTLDVTENINTLLSEGEGLLTFRIHNLTCDKFGNRVSTAEGAEIDYASVKLEVAK